MQLLRYAAIVIVIALCWMSPVGGLEVSPPTPLLPQSPLVISAYSFEQSGLPNYIEIYNNSSTAQPVAEWSLAFEWGDRAGAQATTAPYAMAIADYQGVYFAPGSYTVVSFDRTVDGAHVQVDGLMVEPLNYINKVALRHDAYRPYERTMAASVTQSPMRLNQGASGYTTAYVAENRSSLSATEWYEPLVSSPLRIVEVFPNALTCSPFDQDSLCSDYVKLYNDSDEPVDLGMVRVRTSGANASAAMAGVLPGRSFVSLPLNLTNSGGWVWVEDAYGVVRYDATIVQYADGGGKKGQAWSYDESAAEWRWSAYPTPHDAPNQFTDGSPVNDCRALRLSEIAANATPQFIEVYNTSSEPISLRGCQLQTNRSQDARYVFDDMSLPAGAYAVVHVSDTSLTLTKTTSGTVYIVSSDGQSEVDARSYENLSEGTSFSLVDGVWRQTFSLTPGGENIYQEYPSCKEGYVRNGDTGRCNKMVQATSPADCGPGKYRNEATGRCRNVTAASTLTPCRADQYRNPDTNRCRNIATATSTLTPCKPGQERNPATNRCRSTANAASSLKPCAAGQERNPATNRCRKVAQGDAVAGFKVSNVAAAGDRLVSWLALGGVGVAALSYALWEWRREVYGLLTKVTGVLPFGK